MDNLNISFSTEEVNAKIVEEVIQVTFEGEQWPAWPAWNSSQLGYTHEQLTASMTWTITHNLGRRPWGIHVVDYQGTTYELFPKIHIDENTLQLEFGYALSWFAYIS